MTAIPASAFPSVVASHTDDAGLDRLGEVEEFAAAVAEALGPEAVTLEIDNSLQFVGVAGAEDSEPGRVMPVYQTWDARSLAVGHRCGLFSRGDR